MTRNDLKQLFDQLGLRSNHLVVHASLSSFGNVEGGAPTVCSALLEAVGGGGTVMMPAFTYAETWPGAAAGKPLTRPVAFHADLPVSQGDRRHRRGLSPLAGRPPQQPSDAFVCRVGTARARGPVDPTRQQSARTPQETQHHAGACAVARHVPAVGDGAARGRRALRRSLPQPRHRRAPQRRRLRRARGPRKPAGLQPRLHQARGAARSPPR